MNEHDDPTAALAARGDLDGLLRHLERLLDDRDWDEVLRLRRLSRAAIERGHQLWPAATHAEYRLALEAPGRWCAQVLVPDTGRFAPGPLAEVAANRHHWAEVAAHLDPTPVRGRFAAECVVRGEDLRGAPHAEDLPTELPLHLAAWEPAYPLAEYGTHTVVADAPPSPEQNRWHRVPLGDIADPQTAIVDDPWSTDALRALVAHWVDRSNGRCETLAVSGDHRSALAALGVPSPRVCVLDTAEALAMIAWAAASGGAEGPRRGMAAARFDVWWLLVALGGLTDEWPLDPDEVGAIAADIRWYAWDAHEPATGWALRVIAEDRTDDLAWIVSARDA